MIVDCLTLNSEFLIQLGQENSSTADRRKRKKKKKLQLTEQLFEEAKKLFQMAQQKFW